MKKLITILCILSLVACAGVGVKLSDNSATVLQNSATATVAYLIVKANPEFRDPMVQWYQAFQGVNDLPTVQTMFKEGLAKLSQSVSHDPFLTMQIQSAMNLLEINFEGPQTELDLGKYKGIVDSFMLGVVAVPYNL